MFSLFYACPICERQNCSHHEAAQVTLSPCPFCEGPPVPFATSQRAGFVWDIDESTSVEAHVFCHECGAQGPTIEALCDDESEIPELLLKAVLLWQSRSARHRALYDSGSASGLNQHPRASVETSGSDDGYIFRGENVG